MAEIRCAKRGAVGRLNLKELAIEKHWGIFAEPFLGEPSLPPADR